jgi:spore maturation protein CgeB
VEVCYYRKAGELPELVRRLLGDENRRQTIARSGAEKAWRSHTYGHRARQLLELVGLS